MAKYGDIIAEKTGLGGLWIGLVLVAIATSLPEIFTGVGIILFVGAPDLTVVNLKSSEVDYYVKNTEEVVQFMKQILELM